MRHAVTIAVAASAALLAGCQALTTMSELGTAVGVASGTLTPEQAQSISRSTAAAGKAFESITPEQEYYIGRAVAATILSRYQPADVPEVNQYLNLMGQSLALASDKPETFGGYHFLVLETDDINAFAAPGGLIFVSRGLLRCCPTEDAVAAVLAHEIGHVQHAHGLRAIKKSRLTGAFMTLAAESAKQFGGRELAELTTAFEGAIGDITATLINSGYARKFETQADRAAVSILQRVGYNPRGLEQMLLEMDRRMDPAGPGFAKTHPDPGVRLQAIRSSLAGAPSAFPQTRQKRFEAVMADI